MSTVVLSVKNIHKKYCRVLKKSYIYGLIDMFSAVTGIRLKQDLRAGEFWALKNINFDLHKGKSIALVGANGSGKTTLLKIISGISPQSSGKIKCRGKIAPLLALGAGFKPVLSGRENIKLNLRLLGLTTKEINERFDEIVEFSELGESLEAPLYTYSSGMTARLGFACAIATDAKVLIVDEVLAVGDAKFRAKCRNKINELRKNGVSLLIVSHNPISVLTLADECIYLKKGEIVARGLPLEVLKVYEAESSSEDIKSSNSINNDEGKGRAYFKEVTFSGDKENEPPVSTRSGSIKFSIVSKEELKEVSINIIVTATKPTTQNIQFLQSIDQLGWLTVPAGASEIELNFPSINLKPGQYKFKMNLSCGPHYDIVDILDDVFWDVRDPGGFGLSEFYQEHSWNLDERVTSSGHNGASVTNFSLMEID